jgi:hypothetical protein
VNQKRKSNLISTVTDVTGQKWESQEEIRESFARYFQDLFTAGGPINMDWVLDGLEGWVTQTMNEALLQEFTAEEIGRALAQMDPLKAPGPDGFSACFFSKKNWTTIGVEVSQFVTRILNNGSMNEELNFTYIALIPKVANPICVTDYRPISLCNVLYKLISKTIANRLKLVLLETISQNQSAFIPGRLISDNILAAYETLHTMHSRMWGKVGHMAVKLDMSKAYDRVEWDFLEAVMHRMGFEGRWIRLIMMCVKSVSYGVLVNGSPTGRIIPSKGIRQGDPISPYLFLICAEALSSLLIRADSNGELLGVPTSKRGPRLNHLFFADDSLLFCRAIPSHWHRLAHILKQYEMASGQWLNQDKTSIFL